MFFEQLLVFITELREKLNYTLQSASELLQSDQQMINRMLQLLVENLEQCGMKKSAQKAVDALPPAFGLKADDKKLVYDFFSSFGTSDCTSQLSHCDLYISLIKQLLLSQKDEAIKKTKLVRLLGTFSGIGVGLFFL